MDPGENAAWYPDVGGGGDPNSVPETEAGEGAATRVLRGKRDATVAGIDTPGVRGGSVENEGEASAAPD